MALLECNSLFSYKNIVQCNDKRKTNKQTNYDYIKNLKEEDIDRG